MKTRKPKDKYELVEEAAIQAGDCISASLNKLLVEVPEAMVEEAIRQTGHRILELRHFLMAMFLDEHLISRFQTHAELEQADDHRLGTSRDKQFWINRLKEMRRANLRALRKKRKSV